MATKSKSGKKPKSKHKKSSEGISESIQDHASHLIAEAEKAGESVVGQVRKLFDGLTHGIANVAKLSGGAKSAVDQVREAGEASVRAITEGFDTVRRQITERVATSPSPSPAAPKEKAPKKTTAKKSSAAKKTGQRKTTVSKKPAAKKVTAKKALAKKRTVSKKPAAKKTVAKKKVTKKKT